MSKNDAVVKDVKAVLEKHGLKINYEIAFPRHDVMPDDVRLAWNILIKHGMKITIVLEDIK